MEIDRMSDEVKPEVQPTKLFTCSPKAASRIKEHADKDSKAVGEAGFPNMYPFEQLKVGQCFVVPFGSDPKKTSSRVRKAASVANKRYVGKARFIVIAHKDQQMFEGARIE
jgi:hypothetical protein